MLQFINQPLPEGLAQLQREEVGVAIVIAVDGVSAVDPPPPRDPPPGGIDIAAPVVTVLELYVHVADVECPALTQILTDTEAEEMTVIVGHAGTIVVLALPRLVEGIAEARWMPGRTS